MLGRIESLKVFLEPSSHDRFLRGGELRGRACGARARSCASVRPSVFALARVLVYRMSEHFVFTIRTHTVSFLLIVHFVFTIREGSIYMCVCVFSTVHDSRFGYTGLTTRTPSHAGGTPDGRRRRREGEKATKDGGDHVGVGLPCVDRVRANDDDDDDDDDEKATDDGGRRDAEDFGRDEEDATTTTTMREESGDGR